MKTPTETQRQALELAAHSTTGTVAAAGGGYWVRGDTSLLDRQAIFSGLLKAPWVPTTTVYACERAGWFERCHDPTAHYHKDTRRITDAGRTALDTANRTRRIRP